MIHYHLLNMALTVRLLHWNPTVTSTGSINQNDLLWSPLNIYNLCFIADKKTQPGYKLLQREKHKHCLFKTTLEMPKFDILLDGTHSKIVVIYSPLWSDELFHVLSESSFILTNAKGLKTNLASLRLLWSFLTPFRAPSDFQMCYFYAVRLTDFKPRGRDSAHTPALAERYSYKCDVARIALMNWPNNSQHDMRHCCALYLILSSHLNVPDISIQPLGCTVYHIDSTI